MKDGSDAVSDWPLLNALLNTASGATWVSLHHGGGVGMGYSQHAGMVIVADGTDDAARRLERVLWNDPGTGVMRHADAGYDIAVDCAREQGLDLPMVGEVKLNPQDSRARRLAQVVGRRGARASTTRRCSASPTPPPSVDRIVAGGETVYGVNTGFGLLANTRIPDDRLAELQTNLILSHSAGLGDPLPRHVTRLMIVLKLLGLGRGYSGVRPLVIEALQALLDRDAMPVIPCAGQRRRLWRPRPARAPDRRADGLRPHRRRRRGPACRDGARIGSASSRSQLGAQGRPGADQRHAGVHRDRARRLVHRRARVRRRDRRRRAVGRCAQGLGKAVRPAHLRASRPARPDPRRRRDSRVARRQRDPRPATSRAAGSRTPTASAASRR